MTDIEIANAIVNAPRWMRSFGIRSTDTVYQVGAELPNSLNMVDDLLEDGEYPELDGTSATEAPVIYTDPDPDELEDLAEAIRFNSEYYYFEHQYLIGGRSDHYGDDEREIVIADAEVLAVIR